MSELADLLKRIMDAHEPPLTALGLSQRIATAKRREAHNWIVSSVLNEHRHIPEEDIEVWADALELKGAERTEFILVANLERTPVFVREFVRQIRADQKHLKSDVDRVKRKANDALAALEARDRTIAELRKRLSRYETVS